MASDLEDKKEVKIPIAGRIYPVAYAHDKERESIEQLSEQIEEMLFKLEKTYHIKDKQDALSMCVLQLLIKLDRLTKNQEQSDALVLERLDSLEQILKSIK